jgi:hypothetical protein
MAAMPHVGGNVAGSSNTNIATAGAGNGNMGVGGSTAMSMNGILSSSGGKRRRPMISAPKIAELVASIDQDEKVDNELQMASYHCHRRSAKFICILPIISFACVWM